MTEVLITGANSFIGINFIRFSKYRNVKEISLLETAPENIDFRDVDVVLHLAAIVHQPRSSHRDDYYKVNRDLCKEVANHAKLSGVKNFVFLSTVKVYGKFIPDSDPWNESTACYPDDDYGKSKYEAELALKKLEDSDFIVSVIRTPIVYGPGVKANILRLIKLVEKFPILPFGKVSNRRNYTYVENLVGFIDRIIEVRPSGTFIAMDDTALSTTDLVLFLSKFLYRKIVLFKLPDLFVRTGVTLYPGFFDRLYGSFILDNSKTKELLNYKPPFSPEEGLKRTISFYLESKDQKNFS